MSEKIEQVSRDFVEEVWGLKNLSFLDHNCTEDFRPNMLPPSFPKSLEGFKQYVKMFHTAIPDMKTELEDVVVCKDKTAIRWRIQGTHDGRLMGIEPTGKSVEFTGITILRFEGDQVAEAWAESDQYGFLVQIGHVPPIAAAPPGE